MKKDLLLVLSCILSGFLGYSQVSIQQIKDVAEELELPGLQIVHAKPGEIHSYYWGKLRSDEGQLVNSDTRFQAASLTKVLAAYVFFKLYDSGKMDLDTPLYKYYKYDRIGDNPEAQQVSARMVLTHRTGFHNWEGNVPTDAWRSSKLHTLFKPGSQYKYSGEGFYYLQLMMEAVSEKSFPELIREWILEPFGMNHSDIVWTEAMEGNTASGHRRKGPLKLAKMERPNAAYTLYTTAEDYTRFIQKALNEGEGLTAKTHELMLTKAAEVQKEDSFTESDAHVPIALGVRMQVNEKGDSYWYTGSNPGFRSYFLTYPKTGESLAVFTNSALGFESMPAFFKLFLGDD